jgi:hypothetical protein
MNRFFSSLPLGKIVKRANWSISTNAELFCLAGNHLSVTDLPPNPSGTLEEDVHLDKTVLRCERQTLHRLPKTRALVFAFVSLGLKIQKRCRMEELTNWGEL